MANDDVMQQNIIAELKGEPGVKAAEIGVAVKDGVVSLNGAVDTFAQKFAAERAVERVAGVRDRGRVEGGGSRHLSAH